MLNYLIYVICYIIFFVFNRTNEVTRMKERETNTSMREFYGPSPSTNTTFTLSSYFDGAEIEPSKRNFKLNIDFICIFII